jgi:hypothetical protein
MKTPQVPAIPGTTPLGITPVNHQRHAGDYDQRHGGAWDRGSADSYYWRTASPHYYQGGTGMSKRVEKADMTTEEIAAYHAGYEHNELYGDKKDYG